jgi:ankyrin repeat protein
MRLLLDRGAPVDDLAMVAAASVPGSRSALELLLAHGGHGGAAVPALTALMAAALHGDLEAVNCLLDHGANVKVTSSRNTTRRLRGTGGFLKHSATFPGTRSSHGRGGG